MRIISWNCNCKFRSKFKYLLEEKADIYVVQECENPDIYGDKEYKELFKNGFWTGKIDFKGLGIFSLNPDIQLKKLDWPGKDKEFLFLYK